jgi:hypothetical protein
MKYAFKYEKFNERFAPSCLPDLKKSISCQLRAAKNEISEWEDYDTDYDEIAHSMLFHTTFDLLASGHYHMYAGILNPMSCASNLMTINKKVLEWSVSKGNMTEEKKEEQHRLLVQAIMRIG